MSFFILRDKIRKQNCVDYIMSLPDAPLIGVRVQPYERKRSLAQNNTFHMWCNVISEYSGYSVDEVKNKLVLSLWEPVTKDVTVFKGNEKVKYTLAERRSTAEMNVEELHTLLNATEVLAAKLQLKLPYPDDYLDR